MTDPQRLADIAREIERIRPGALPKSLLPYDIAETLLIGAMVMAANDCPQRKLSRDPDGWTYEIPGVMSFVPLVKLDADYGSPLESCYSAFRAATESGRTT